MNADSAYIEPFLYDWVDRLQEIMQEREQEIINEKNLIVPCEVLTLHIVKSSTYIADYLRLDHHVKYTALELFDKFINKYFWEAYNEKRSKEWLKDFKKKVCTYSTLYLVSCFQVACKVNSHPNGLRISQVLQLLYLFDTNFEYTRDMVSSTEVEILKKVGFKMPLYTPVYCIEILLAAIHFLKIPFNETRESIEYEELLFNTTSMELLDLAYLKHEELYRHYKSYLVSRNLISKQENEMELKLRILKSNTLFLSAAIVLCTRYILYPCVSDINISIGRIVTANLAKLANVTDTDVTVMANILFQIMQYSKK